MKNTIVLYHSADYDGLFCREIARKFVGDKADYHGFDYGEQAPVVPKEATLYMLDISIPGLMNHPGLVWIDHHQSAIQEYGSTGLHDRIPGYRIDGVAACRLAWQWFTHEYASHVPGNQIGYPLPKKQDFIDRKTVEPCAVRLVGEHDIWDHRDPRASLLQFGLDSVEDIDWGRALSTVGCTSDGYVSYLCERGEAAEAVISKRNADVMRERAFDVQWEGLNFLACNFVRCNSQSFTGGIKHRHDALLSFYYNGKVWSVSLYHAPGNEHHDLSTIAVKYGGGGHRGACGFRCDFPPFLTK